MKRKLPFSLQLTSIRFRLFLLALVLTLPMVVLLFYSAERERRQISAGVKANALAITDLVSANQQRLISDTSQQLTLLANQPELQYGDAKVCSNYLAYVIAQNPKYTSIVVADLKGDIYCSAIPIAQPTNVMTQPLFQNTIQTRRFSIGDYQIGRPSGKPILGLGTVVFDAQNDLRGLILAGLDLSWLNQSASVLGSELPQGFALTILDNKGVIIAQYPDTDHIGTFVGDIPVFKAALSSPTGSTTEGAGIDGVDKLYAYTHLGEPALLGQITLLIGIPKSVAFAPANHALRRNLIGLAVVALASLPILGAAVEILFVKPIRALVEATQKLSAGDFKQRIGLRYGGGELSQLAKAFNNMAIQLEEREYERTRRIRSEIMVREIQHRVKNSLQVASSLLSLQAGTLRDPAAIDAFKESEARIRTMGSVYSKLLLNDGVAIMDFGRFLRETVPEIVESLGALPRINVKVVTTELPMDTESSVTISLIVNELVTNAVKHAFSNKETGLITVQAKAENSQMTLIVSDNGKGMPAHDSSGLGLQLVDALVAQLNGVLEVDSKEGTTFKITFPRPNYDPKEK